MNFIDELRKHFAEVGDDTFILLAYIACVGITLEIARIYAEHNKKGDDVRT